LLKNEKTPENYLDLKIDMPPNSLKDPNVGSIMKQRKKKVGARSLTHNTLGIGGRVGAPR
jgi:hypothetical protein